MELGVKEAEKFRSIFNKVLFKLLESIWRGDMEETLFIITRSLIASEISPAEIGLENIKNFKNDAFNLVKDIYTNIYKALGLDKGNYGEKGIPWLSEEQKKEIKEILEKQAYTIIQAIYRKDKHFLKYIFLRLFASQIYNLGDTKEEKEKEYKLFTYIKYYLEKIDEGNFAEVYNFLFDILSY